MSLMSSLERRFGGWAIPNLTNYLLALHAIGVVLLMGKYKVVEDLILVGGLVQVGQWWRLVTFMFLPAGTDPLWLVFEFYILWLMGGALEKEWGTFRYNLFILTGYLLTVAAAFISPSARITDTYFLGCILLAFATHFPYFEFRLFFLIPVQVRWFGWVTAVGYVLTVVSGDAHARTAAGAALCNYLLFFGKDIVRNLKASQRRRSFQAQSTALEGQPRHECAECGITEKNNPTMDFRYCSECGKCFCEEHINRHAHEEKP